MSTQLVTPDLTVKDGAGWCLRFTQTVWGAPARYESAWQAWEATEHKHTDALPDVAVPVWFEHWGNYGYYANWGHVVSYVPGMGFLSSPTSGVGQVWLPDIASVERTFNSKYVGWTEDINGLRVADVSDNPKPLLGKTPTMYIISSPMYRSVGKQVVVTDSAGAYEIPNVIAVGMRRAVPAVDFDNEDEFNGQVNAAWERANKNRDMLVKAIKNA